ncbi:hypothetical protein TIFTF001_013942 [Ficus carica]|uniref:Uncharacterized protein n=1 Tax=Ficus carica TaxID=3494 RepID=A0AA87ZVW4_FICCA|nr:hypothetical protein TIFTF001_013942 [Ficus carica]
MTESTSSSSRQAINEEGILPLILGMRKGHRMEVGRRLPWRTGSDPENEDDDDDDDDDASLDGRMLFFYDVSSTWFNVIFGMNSSNGKHTGVQDVVSPNL